MQAGRSNEANETEGVADSGDHLPEFVKVVGIFLEFAQLFDLTVEMLCPFVRIKARVVFFFCILFEPFSVSA